MMALLLFFGLRRGQNPMDIRENVGRVVGSGHYVPELIVHNRDLEATAPTSHEWVAKNLGIQERRRIAAGETTADLAAAAARVALKDADIAADTIDMLILATSTPDRKSPSTACLVHEMLGLGTAAAFDLQAVCSGFLYAFSLAQSLLATGGANRVLVVGADCFSTITDWSRRDCVFFGDGAGAVVLERGQGKGLYVSELYADGTGKDGFTVFPGDKAFTMDARAVYDTATTVLPAAIENVLAQTNLSIKDIALLVPHQPSIRVLKETARIIGLPWQRVMTNMSRYANTSAGTIPIALAEALAQGRIASGDNVLFAAVGSGWTWGASVYRWP
jgi:3-oxoacyl-[acyl-carrier-protein] synthase III